MTLCFLCAIGSGAAMPLMFVVFGRLVGNFTGYFTADSGVTYRQFMDRVIQNTSVDSLDPLLPMNFPMTKTNSLYMVYIGIARFGLSYISLVSTLDTPCKRPNCFSVQC